MRQPHASFLEKGRGRLIGTLEDDDESMYVNNFNSDFMN